MSEGLSSLVQHLSEFRTALLPGDQAIFDEILQPLLKRATSKDAADIDLPVETLLLAMLIEEHRENARLKEIIKNMQPTEVSSQKAGENVR